MKKSDVTNMFPEITDPTDGQLHRAIMTAHFLTAAKKLETAMAEITAQHTTDIKDLVIPYIKDGEVTIKGKKIKAKEK